MLGNAYIQVTSSYGQQMTYIDCESEHGLCKNGKDLRCPFPEIRWRDPRIPKAANWHKGHIPILKIAVQHQHFSTVSARFAFARRVLACCGPKVRSRTSRTLRYIASLSSLAGGLAGTIFTTCVQMFQYHVSVDVGVLWGHRRIVV